MRGAPPQRAPPPGRERNCTDGSARSLDAAPGGGFLDERPAWAAQAWR